jgi:hypothetical protein
MQVFYNIHNILKIVINNNLKCNFFDRLNNDLSYFQVEEFNNPDITLYLGDFVPQNDDCYAVDHKYYIKDNYLYCHDNLGQAKYETEIFGFEENETIINFNFKLKKPNILNLCLPMYIFLLEGLITYKLASKGYYLIHAAGVSKNGKALILAGRGGSFKTSIVMDMIRELDFKYMSDDKIILKNNTVFAFPLNVHRFNFMMGNMENEKYKNILDKFNLLLYLIRNVDNYELPVESKSIMHNLLLITKAKSDKISVNTIKRENVLQKLVENNRLELSLHGSHLPSLTKIKTNPFYRYMLEYSYIYPESQIARYWTILYNGLYSSVLSDVTEVQLPEKYNKSQVLSVIKDLLDK